ncbi:MAG: septum formation initiator family protein [Ruminococcaceae bacterium]|nr:septum formation initiator family protein [Oscillospiraceae bacterium]
MMIFAIVTIVAMHPKMEKLEAEKAALQKEVNEMQQDNLALADRIDALGTDDSTRQIAREQLNMVEDGQIVYVDTSK